MQADPRLPRPPALYRRQFKNFVQLTSICPVSLLSKIVIFVALGAVAIVLLLGLANMMKGGSANRSQQLMRWRVVLQGLAIVVVMVVAWVAGQG